MAQKNTSGLNIQVFITQIIIELDLFLCRFKLLMQISIQIFFIKYVSRRLPYTRMFPFFVQCVVYNTHNLLYEQKQVASKIEYNAILDFFCRWYGVVECGELPAIMLLAAVASPPPRSAVHTV